MADPITASSLISTYAELLQAQPLATKCTTASVLSCLGDAIAQYGAAVNNKQPFEYDSKRGAAFLAFGCVYTGFFQHFWFQYLNAHLIVSDVPQGSPWDASTLTAASKVVVNQCGAIAGLYMPTFFVLTAWLGDMSVKEGWDRAKTMYAPLVLRNWTFWFPTQFVQFSLIPDAWHIPYLSVMSLIWTVILSTLGNVSKQPGPPKLPSMPASGGSSDNSEVPVTQSKTQRTFSSIQNGLPVVSSSRLSGQEVAADQRPLVPIRRGRQGEFSGRR